MTALCIFTVFCFYFYSSPQSNEPKSQEACSLTRGEVICAEQSTMNETALDSAIFYSNISISWDNRNEIHKKINQKTFTLMAIWLSFTKENAELFIFILFFLPWLYEQKPEKKIPNEGWNSESVMEFGAHPHKWECREIWYSCACSPRGKFFTYIWLCIVSIPQLAMRISASPSLIQAGHRGCQISRAILKYSTAVRDQTRVLMLGVLVCRMERRMRVEEEGKSGRWRKKESR